MTDPIYTPVRVRFLISTSIGRKWLGSSVTIYKIGKNDYCFLQTLMPDNNLSNNLKILTNLLIIQLINTYMITVGCILIRVPFGMF